MTRAIKIFGLCLALAAVAALTIVNPSAAQTTNRPLSDFLNAQGTTSNFFPPIPDYVGWVDNPNTTFALVDYAGLAAKYLAAHGGPSLGTTITGGVTETRLADGRYEVTVTANAQNALAWASPYPGDITTDPTVFGSRANAIAANPALPVALVSSQLKVTFITTAAGAPIPDLTGPVPYNLKSIKFSANGPGPVPGGATARLTVIQSGLFNTGFHGATADGFPAEKITIK
jgi:hypothetical protein